MSLWRLEWLRMVRTRRLLVLAGVYLFFGFLAGPTARYTSELISRFGGGVKVELPQARPVDGLADYVSNASQLGILAFVMVVASAVAVDAHREMAVFLRTRTVRYSDVLLPRFVVSVGVGLGAFSAGMLAAWYGTRVLLGPVDASAVLVGTLLACVYLTFLAAVATAVSSAVRSVGAAVGATLGIAVAVGILGIFEPLRAWSPSVLVGAVTDLSRGGGTTTFVQPALVTAGLIAALLALAIRRGARREL